MAQTKEGALKCSAKKAGIPLADYLALLSQGQKRCTSCKTWKPAAGFGKDLTRHDGLSAKCFSCCRVAVKIPRSSWTAINPKTGRPGPEQKPPRDGDRTQARQRVNVEVRTGRLKRPNDLPCSFCGHIVSDTGMRHEYHHHKGYGAPHQLDVIALCTKCHASVDGTKSQWTRCIHGHEYTPENTGRKATGHRFCRECRRIRDRGRRNAEFWRQYRVKKKAAGRLLDGVEHNGFPGGAK